MPRISSLERSKTCCERHTITSTLLLPFLLPAYDLSSLRYERKPSTRGAHSAAFRSLNYRDSERFFFSVLARAGSHHVKRPSGNTFPGTLTSGHSHRKHRNFTSTPPHPETDQRIDRNESVVRYKETPKRRLQGVEEEQLLGKQHERIRMKQTRGGDQEAKLGALNNDTAREEPHNQELRSTPHNFARRQTHFPLTKTWSAHTSVRKANVSKFNTEIPSDVGFSGNPKSIGGEESGNGPDTSRASLTDQLRLIQTVRDLEKKLERARHNLHQTLKLKPTPVRRRPDRQEGPYPHASNTYMDEKDDGKMPDTPQITLTKEDYLNLVDLYFYSHQSRFAPDNPDMSPNPLFLEDYSFKLSEDFSKPNQHYVSIDRAEEEEPEGSPLQHIQEILKSRQLREISSMQIFIDFLLNDRSSNKGLYEAYKLLPDPGVAHLPRGVIRLFLQRMSTPWTKSVNSMLRYLSLIDDMQRASLPITAAEWSSAIYLAGRSFSRVTESDLKASFRIWKDMEHKAGVQGTHVTFNILFDIAVRAGKFVLAETILKEMHERGLRLNRLGRVSLIYYHGRRGDGDGVRKSYRDFVQSGEIVDTLVLNCVMASLINAQEPTAAEQVYERMKSLQSRLRKGQTADGEEALFVRYPPPGATQLDAEMASNSLGRILLNAARLRDILPDQHSQLQNKMPLVPDADTFRILLSHHAKTSGDLDRLTVLMNDMTKEFDIPLNTLSFHLLFKGFAIHGGSKRNEAKWTTKRLEIAWNACWEAVRQRRSKGLSAEQTKEEISVPSLRELEGYAEEGVSEEANAGATASKKKLSAWDAFIADFMSTSRHDGTVESYFSSPFFSQNPDGPVADPDTEYTLPSADSRFENSSSIRSQLSEVTLSASLVVWIIRAYTKCTGSRNKLEEIWFHIRKAWKPADMTSRNRAVRVLRDSLRQCDRN